MKQGRSRGLLSVSYVIALHRSKSGSGRWPVAYSGKVTEAWITTSFFLQAAHVRMRGARVRQCCEGPTFTSDARLALPSASRALCCVVVCVAMSGAGVASRTADPVSLPAELPVRLYMRALRQYQKLLDLRRLTSKDKVSQHP